VIRELHLLGGVGAAAQPIAGKPAPTPIVVASGHLEGRGLGAAGGKQKRPTFR